MPLIRKADIDSRVREFRLQAVGRSLGFRVQGFGLQVRDVGFGGFRYSPDKASLPTSRRRQELGMLNWALLFCLLFAKGSIN